MRTFGYACTAADAPLSPFHFDRLARSDLRYRFVIDMASPEAA